MCIKDMRTTPKWGRIEGGRWEWLRWEGLGGIKTTVLGQQLKKKNKIMKSLKKIASILFLLHPWPSPKDSDDLSSLSLG